MKGALCKLSSEIVPMTFCGNWLGSWCLSTQQSPLSIAFKREDGQRTIIQSIFTEMPFLLYTRKGPAEMTTGR